VTYGKNLYTLANQAGNPLQGRLPYFVLGKTLNCLFTLQASSREALPENPSALRPAVLASLICCYSHGNLI